MILCLLLLTMKPMTITTLRSHPFIDLIAPNIDNIITTYCHLHVLEVYLSILSLDSISWIIPLFKYPILFLEVHAS